MTKEIQAITFVLGGYPDTKEEDKDWMRLIIDDRDAAKSLLKKLQSVVDDKQERRTTIFVNGDGTVRPRSEIEQLLVEPSSAPLSDEDRKWGEEIAERNKEEDTVSK